MVRYIYHKGGLGDCGVIGEPTNLRDKNGTLLCVGDLVRVQSTDGTYCNPEPTFVVNHFNYIFIMGIAGACNNARGEINPDWEVTLAEGCYNIPVGSEYNQMEVCLKPTGLIYKYNQMLGKPEDKVVLLLDSAG